MWAVKVVIGLDVGGTKTNATILDDAGTFLIDRMVGQPLFAHVTLEKGERSELAELASNLL